MLNIVIFDQSMNMVDTIDGKTFSSLVWSERYSEKGDFVLELPPDTRHMQYLLEDNYIYIPDSDRLMVIEDVETIKDVTRKVVITGNSLEYVLERRAVKDVISVSGNVNLAITEAIYHNLTDCIDPFRVIPRWSMLPTNDVRILTAISSEQFITTSLYNMIKTLSMTSGIGFRATMDDSREFIFELYCGYDRSHGQTDRPWVVFSDNFDNVLNSSHHYITSTSKNVSLVVINDDVVSLQRTMVSSQMPPPFGMSRREVVSNATDITRNVVDGDDLTDLEISNLITARGLTDLSDLKPITIFEGEVNILRPFKYGEDFYLGDIVQHISGNNSNKARIVEVIRTYNKAGYNVHVSFDFDYVNCD